jgi:transcriptional regulator with XRE-family HTH domain
MERTVDKAVIGARMRQQREKLGLSAAALAQRIGTSKAQVSRLETGKQGFRSDMLLKVAEALNVDPVFFMVDQSKVDALNAHALVSRRVIDAMRSPEYTHAAECLAALHRKKHSTFQLLAGLLDVLAGRGV